MFYTIGQRKKWERVLYIVLPILSVALVVGGDVGPVSQDLYQPH